MSILPFNRSLELLIDHHSITQEDLEILRIYFSSEVISHVFKPYIMRKPGVL